MLQIEIQSKFRIYLFSFHLCTYSDDPITDPSSPCKRDNGGPLMVRDEENGGRYKNTKYTSTSND